MQYRGDMLLRYRAWNHQRYVMMMVFCFWFWLNIESNEISRTNKISRWKPTGTDEKRVYETFSVTIKAACRWLLEFNKIYLIALCLTRNGIFPKQSASSGCMTENWIERQRDNLQVYIVKGTVKEDECFACDPIGMDAVIAAHLN